MKQSFETISIQHELAMAIGDSLDLQETAQSFLQALNTCLKLNSSHLFLYGDQDSELKQCEKTSSTENVFHYLSVPQSSYDGYLFENGQLLNAVREHLGNLQDVSVFEISGQVCLISSIPEYGVAVCEGIDDVDESIQKALIPIFKKFALSCYACLAHQSLIREVAARKIAEDLVAHQTSHDELTQLFNRRKLTESLNSAIDYCEEHKKFGALIFIDLNQFKSINDVSGHDVGDKILKEVANRLKGIIRENDTVARFGGDEFVVLLPELGDNEEVAEQIVNRTAVRVLDIIEEPFVIESLIYALSCSTGYDIFPAVNNSSRDFIKNADLAMYEAKVLRKRVALRYLPSMSEKLNIRSVYVTELKNALKNNEFTLHYQPQYNYDNQIIGAEALLRWNNPKRIQESPEIYIPIAEDSELILAIGDWVLHESCRQLKILQQQGLPDSFKKLSINVSAKQLGQENFFDNICRAIKTSGVNAGQMTIEITENILVSRIHDAMTLISQLGDIGVDCAIDDFGTGYSSLTYLRRLPSSLIKIDKNFVRDIHKDANNRSIAKMIVALGDNLEMDILAEGVETLEELECLKGLGCHQYQGFYFSKPLPFEQFLSLIKLRDLEVS